MNYDKLETIVINYNLMESVNDFRLVSYAMNTDELSDFVGFLLLGDWSRNISILPEEWQDDSDVKELFDYIDLHCKK